MAKSTQSEELAKDRFTKWLAALPYGLRPYSELFTWDDLTARDKKHWLYLLGDVQRFPIATDEWQFKSDRCKRCGTTLPGGPSEHCLHCLYIRTKDAEQGVVTVFYVDIVGNEEGVLICDTRRQVEDCLDGYFENLDDYDEIKVTITQRKMPRVVFDALPKAEW